MLAEKGGRFNENDSQEQLQVLGMDLLRWTCQEAKATKRQRSIKTASSCGRPLYTECEYDYEAEEKLPNSLMTPFVKLLSS